MADDLDIQINDWKYIEESFIDQNNYWNRLIFKLRNVTVFGSFTKLAHIKKLKESY